MSFEKGALIILCCAWFIVGASFWFTFHDKCIRHYQDSKPKTWKLALILPLCGPIPIIIIWFITLSRLFEKFTDTLARWVTK